MLLGGVKMPEDAVPLWLMVFTIFVLKKNGFLYLLLELSSQNDKFLYLAPSDTLLFFLFGLQFFFPGGWRRELSFCILLIIIWPITIRC